MIKEYLIIPFSGGLSPINVSYTYQFNTIVFLGFLERISVSNMKEAAYLKWQSLTLVKYCREYFVT